REPEGGAHRLQVLVVRRLDVALLELPGRLLAEHAGGGAALVALDDAAGNLEIAVRARERGRVQPERVVVLREQGGRDVPGDGVERLLRRFLAPVGAAPSLPPQPAPG